MRVSGFCAPFNPRTLKVVMYANKGWMNSGRKKRGGDAKKVVLREEVVKCAAARAYRRVRLNRLAFIKAHLILRPQLGNCYASAHAYILAAVKVAGKFSRADAHFVKNLKRLRLDPEKGTKCWEQQ